MRRRIFRRRLAECERDLASNGLGYRYFHALELPVQARVWNLREAALGLSMTMKEDSKSLSFVEDTAVAPEKLRDYIERFMALIRRHNTTAGVYAHASVGCLHVRPVVNMKTAEGIRKFEAIATEVADLVLEFGGALSGEHGDGLVRSPFMQKMFGPVLYEAFRTIKRTFDPYGIFNPGKIVDSPPITENLRFGAGYVSPNPRTYFDYSEYGGMGGAVEMCSGLGVCRKTHGRHDVPFLHGDEGRVAHHSRARECAAAGDGGEVGLGRVWTIAAFTTFSIFVWNAGHVRRSVRWASIWRGSRASFLRNTGRVTGRRCTRRCSAMFVRLRNWAARSLRW